MWTQTFIILIISVLCSAENEITNTGRARNPFKYHHGLHYLRHYWIFLAIKAKIIFLVGTFISFWMFAGKVFAFLYYIVKKKENCKCPEYHYDHHDHHEPFVVPDIPAHFEHKYSTLFNSGNDYPGPSNTYSGPTGSSYYPFEKPQFSRSDTYSRNMKSSIFGNFDIFKSFIKNTDLTELAFDAMNLKRTSCKKRFVCEAEQEVKNNSVLGITLYMFSERGFNKYRTNTTIFSKEDCISLGPYCSYES